MGNSVTNLQTSNPAIYTPMDLLTQASNNGAPLETLEKYMDMHDRWEAGNAKKSYLVAMNDFKTDPPVILKTKQVRFDTRSGDSVGYKHAELGRICDLIIPALSAHGITHCWQTHQPDAGTIEVTCILTHVDGHCEKTKLKGPPETSGTKNSLQAISSTITTLERYTLLAAVGLAASDQDDDGAGAVDGFGGVSRFIDEKQKDILLDKMRDVGADTKGFLNSCRVETIDQLPKDKFQGALNRLNAKGALKRGKK